MAEDGVRPMTRRMTLNLGAPQLATSRTYSGTKCRKKFDPPHTYPNLRKQLPWQIRTVLQQHTGVPPVKQQTKEFDAMHPLSFRLLQNEL